MHANVAGTLLISTGAFDDDSTALWEISGNIAAVLTIAVGGTPAALQGAFEIHDNGTLRATSSGFHTSGPLQATSGWISVVAGQELIFSE